MAVEYSLDNGVTFNPATVTGNSDITSANPGKIVWSTFTDMGYVVEKEALIRLLPSDAKAGVSFLAGPFKITNLVGDFTSDLRVDGSDLLGFTQTWKYQILSREMGPVTGEPPYLTVIPDGKVNFEDLAGFVWMWNWFSTQVAAKDIAAPIPDTPANTETQDKALSFTTGVNGGVEVSGTLPLDYLRLLAEPGDGVRVTFDAGNWWTRDGDGIFLIRSYPGQVYEAAATLLKERSATDAGIIPFGTMHLDGFAGDMRVRYEYRVSGEEEIDQ